MIPNKGLAWIGPNHLELISKELRPISDSEILIRVEVCAICGSDLRIWKEGNSRIQSGRVIGHEIAGTVVQTGKNVSDFKNGDRVATGADVPCGRCDFCLSGRSNCCRTNYAIGYQFDGGFADYMIVPEIVVKNGPLHKFSDKISFELAAMAEPLACCLNGYEIAMADRLRPKIVVIFGAGPIGLLLASLAPIYGAEKVIVIDPAEQRLQFAKKLPQVTHIVSGRNAVADVLKLTDGAGADLIFTACPDASSHSDAIQLLAVRGVLNLFGGLPKNSPPVQLDSNFIHYREAYITGSHGSTPAQHRQALKLIESGAIDLQNFISKKFPLSEYAAAFDLAASQTAMKVLITGNGVSNG